jgi:hypothetical protein
MKGLPLLSPALLCLLVPLQSAAQPDARQLVELPPMMQQHMLANMRDHLSTLHEIQQALASTDYDKAADLAEQRLGMSSMPKHGAAHMAPFMPRPMQTIGTEMHHAASQFAVIARESAVEGNTAKALGALSKVTGQCIACHSRYRIR